MSYQWPSGSRDTTEFPDISVEIKANLRDHLKAFTKLEGVDWNDYDAQKQLSGLDVEDSRIRTYRKMYERIGMISKVDGKIKLTDIGKALVDLKGVIEVERNKEIQSLALRACRTLVRYVFKNPVDKSAAAAAGLPPDCDIRPFFAIFKAMSELDGKLHFEELNRVLIKIMRMSEIDKAIEVIRNARTASGGNYSDKNKDALEKLLGPESITDQPSARMAPWFSNAGWGGLLIESHADSDGFRNFTDIAKTIMPDFLNEPLIEFKGDTEEDWYKYYNDTGPSASSTVQTEVSTEDLSTLAELAEYIQEGFEQSGIILPERRSSEANPVADSEADDSSDDNSKTEEAPQ